MLYTNVCCTLMYAVHYCTMYTTLINSELCIGVGLIHTFSSIAAHLCSFSIFKLFILKRYLSTVYLQIIMTRATRVCSCSLVLSPLHLHSRPYSNHLFLRSRKNWTSTGTCCIYSLVHTTMAWITVAQWLTRLADNWEDLGSYLNEGSELL